MGGDLGHSSAFKYCCFSLNERSLFVSNVLG